MKIYNVIAVRYMDDHHTYPGYVVGSFNSREVAEDAMREESEISGREEDTFMIEVMEI